MADILSYLNAIKTAVYGKDVRNSIHDAIRQCYDDGKAGSIDPTARSQIANLVAHNNDTSGNSELIDIRVGADGTTYPSAGEAVRKQVNALLDKMDFKDVYKNVYEITCNKQDSSVEFTHDEFVKMLNGDSFCYKFVQTDSSEYANLYIRASAYYEYTNHVASSYCPSTALTKYINDDGVYEILYKVSVSDFENWYNASYAELVAADEQAAGAVKLVFYCPQHRIASVDLINKVRSYTDDCIVYEEEISEVDPNFASLVNQVIESSKEDSGLTDAEQIAKERLSGKTIIFMGDSYTKGAESQFSALCAKYGAMADNYGIVSSSICGTTDGNKGFQPMWNRTSNVCSTYTSNGKTSNVGAIVFMGGANDGIGNSTWIGSGINDDNTGHIYGAMNSILTNFRKTFDCPIFVILQPTMPNGKTDNQTASSATASLWGFDSAAQCAALDSDHFARYSQYVKQTAVKACAEYHDCQVVDCFFNWDISVFSQSQKATYWRSDGHPTSDGYQHIADTLEKKMLDIFGAKLSPL